jgi:hypothetical protein
MYRARVMSARILGAGMRQLATISHLALTGMARNPMRYRFGVAEVHGCVLDRQSSYWLHLDGRGMLRIVITDVDAYPPARRIVHFRVVGCLRICR